MTEPPDELAPSLLDRLKTGAGVGAAFSVFVPLILLGALLERSWEFEARGALLHAGVLALTYPLGAMATGAVFMSLHPYLTNAPLLYAWGMISMVPWSFGIAVAMERGYADWTSLHTFLVIAGCLLGIAVAAGFGGPTSTATPHQRG
jgi:hypothetical protein